MINKQIINTFPVPSRLLENEDFIKLKPCEKVILFYFLKCQDKYKKDVFYCTLKDICSETGVSKTTIIQAKKTLATTGFLKIIKKHPYDPDCCCRFKTRVPDYYSIEFLFEIKEE